MILHDDANRDFLRIVWVAIGIIVGVPLLLAIALLAWLASQLIAFPAFAHDDGRFAASPLKPWFDKLASGKGLCCSFADGKRVEDVDWDTKDGSYRVRLDDQWIVVPDNAVVTEPNKFGPAVVWPYQDIDGTTQIRCFMPGSGA